jgi:hypothetical protein
MKLMTRDALYRPINRRALGAGNPAETSLPVFARIGRADCG